MLRRGGEPVETACWPCSVRWNVQAVFVTRVSGLGHAINVSNDVSPLSDTAVLDIVRRRQWTLRLLRLLMTAVMVRVHQVPAICAAVPGFHGSDVIRGGTSHVLFLVFTATKILDEARLPCVVVA